MRVQVLALVTAIATMTAAWGNRFRPPLHASATPTGAVSAKDLKRQATPSARPLAIGEARSRKSAKLRKTKNVSGELIRKGRPYWKLE